MRYLIHLAAATAARLRAELAGLRTPRPSPAEVLESLAARAERAALAAESAADHLAALLAAADLALALTAAGGAL